jgi:GNAT superfamily N-acetyltransferase
MSEIISPASSEADYRAYAGIIEEYVAWIKARFLDDTWFVNEVFGHQSLSSEILELSKKYGPPSGKTLMVRCDGQIAGAGAYHRINETCCEMKRVFIRDQYQGRGFGRMLCTALIGSARHEGYHLMRLDTANRLSEAISMYQSLGFVPCPAYLRYPDKLMPYLIFMEKTLA